MSATIDAGEIARLDALIAELRAENAALRAQRGRDMVRIFELEQHNRRSLARDRR